MIKVAIFGRHSAAVSGIEAIQIRNGPLAPGLVGESTKLMIEKDVKRNLKNESNDQTANLIIANSEVSIETSVAAIVQSQLGHGALNQQTFPPRNRVDLDLIARYSQAFFETGHGQNFLLRA